MAAEHLTVRFYLKPHLHGFVRCFLGTDTIDAVDTNVLGSMALACLTPKLKFAMRESTDWRKGRKVVVARLGMRQYQYQGACVVSSARFEQLVEHLFFHLMLQHVDGQLQLGRGQNESIRNFLDQYQVDLATVEFDSIKKTIIRRRKRMQAATTKH